MSGLVELSRLSSPSTSSSHNASPSVMICSRREEASSSHTCSCKTLLHRHSYYPLLFYCTVLYCTAVQAQGEKKQTRITPFYSIKEKPNHY